MTAEELAARSEIVQGAPDLRALLEHLRARARPVLERMPHIPEHKALISLDGGKCPDDGNALTFDPWKPTEHRCPRCGKTWRGERHDRYWARHQHLWIAERAAHLAAVAAFGGGGDASDKPAGARAREILQAYAERYWRYPNRDNVLGPSRLFFSTYIESVWLCNYLAAAALLQASDQLDDATRRGVNQVADEAATLIGDYDETFSNRQTWNNAALAAVAVWFEDEDLARRVIEGDTGLIAHLVRGYGRDGMWYEGENYHLFALRGLLTGASWASLAGVDFAADPRLGERLRAALWAPALSALPDFTFPARKDARFGVSLVQPAHVELWEIGLARLADHATEQVGEAVQGLMGWLQALYRDAKPVVVQEFESYLHDAPMPEQPVPISRSALSWWSLLEMLPALEPPRAEYQWKPGSVLLESQGLGVLRHDDRYVSLETGRAGGGHAHPDYLHITLHAHGVHWLPDPGTGSYFARDLFWYRSVLAHNSPRLDGETPSPTIVACECFDAQAEWGWVRGRVDDLYRTVVAGPAYIIDVTDLVSREDHLLEQAWHLAGRGVVETPGRWVDDALPNEFVTRVQRFVPDQAAGGGGGGEGPLVLEHVMDHARLKLHLLFAGDLLEAEGPGLPGKRQQERAKFYIMRARGRNIRFVNVLEPHPGETTVQSVRLRGDVIEVQTTTGVDLHRFTGSSWVIEPAGRGSVALAGAREPRPPFTPLLEIDAPTPALAPAFRVGGAPPLDGTLEGFDLAEPLLLTMEDQYRRSEDGYPGAEEFSAAAYAAWDERALYLAVEVTKPDICLRSRSEPPLKLDNEPDDIHSDGLQVYVAPPVDLSGGPRNGRRGAVGYLIVPNNGESGVRVRPTSDTPAEAIRGEVVGSWRRTEHGYRVTVSIPWPEQLRPHAGGRVAFDLIINEGLPGRMRRAGQLVWSGGNGWIWLRGDRQDVARFGLLELVE